MSRSAVIERYPFGGFIVFTGADGESRAAFRTACFAEAYDYAWAALRGPQALGKMLIKRVQTEAHMEGRRWVVGSEESA